MTPLTTKRAGLRAFPGLWRGCLAGLVWLAAVDGASGADDFAGAMRRIEARAGVRVGCHAMRGATEVGYRARERFAYCSTFKWILCADILREVDAGRLSLGQVVRYGTDDLLEYSPVTRGRVAGGISVGELCAATLRTSDNPAANLLEDRLGGPAGLQAFVRGLGDTVTRFDRREPELNSNLPGDTRDTTTPEAMTRLLKTVREGDALSVSSRRQLQAWMEACETGDRRIRAGVPAGWRVADKTGTGANGAANDVAILHSGGGQAIYLTVFVDGGRLDGGGRDRIIADVARAVVAALR